MTKKLESLFDLDSKVNTLKEPAEIEGENDLNEPIIPVTEPEIPQKTLTNLAKIEESLTLVKGLEASDAELNELAELAQESYKDLMDLGMNVDSRYSSDIFAVASNLLGHAISAKTAKINKKLKMIDLQIKKARIDKIPTPIDEQFETTGHGYILDRNEILKELIGKEMPKDEE
mgnify:CR=1 FL=1|jgi:hypothetical protein|tara:strand:+ start:1259 stop:1780 length:522 start_codon:yes stop_codon:yes gene_type:complete